MIEALRKEVRRLSGIRLDHNYLSLLVENEIVKRELVDSDEGQTATTYVKKLQRAAKERPEPVTAPAVMASAPAVIAPTS
jgi:hypothetical protein